MLQFFHWGEYVFQYPVACGRGGGAHSRLILWRKNGANHHSYEEGFVGSNRSQSGKGLRTIHLSGNNGAHPRTRGRTRAVVGDWRIGDGASYYGEVVGGGGQTRE